MSFKKSLLSLMAVALLAVGLTACAPTVTEEATPTAATATEAPQATEKALSGKVTVSGSTSVEDLANALGTAFEQKHTGVTVDVQAGGSSVGVNNAKDGITNIGNSSRELKESEKGFGLTEYIIAFDGIAMVVNPANPVSNLTTEQISKIYMGEITNWKDVGGDNAAIVVIGREAGSGTRGAFEELTKTVDKCKYTVECAETGIVKAKVVSEKYGIGYTSLDKVDATVKTITVNGVAATAENVLNKTFVLQRPFLMLTKGAENKVTKAFLDFILSAEGQAIVEESGFVKVK